MASLLRSSGTPRCLSCLRRFTASMDESIFVPAQQQVRGKKTNARDRDTTVKVRLIRNVVRFGPAGAVVALSPGRMRNDFLPNRKAEYLTKAQLKSMGLLNTAIHRDGTYGRERKIIPETTDQQYPEARRYREDQKISVKVDLVDPERAADILEMLLPDNIDFYRTPIASTLAPVATTPPQRQSPSISGSARLSDEAQVVKDAREAAQREAETAARDHKVSIYGSVTTADIVSNLKAVLEEDAEGQRVVFGPEDVSFLVEEGEETDRVKHLGIFEFQINVKGAPFAVTRTIRVNPQE